MNYVNASCHILIILDHYNFVLIAWQVFSAPTLYDADLVLVALALLVSVAGHPVNQGRWPAYNRRQSVHIHAYMATGPLCSALAFVVAGPLASSEFQAITPVCLELWQFRMLSVNAGGRPRLPA